MEGVEDSCIEKDGEGVFDRKVVGRFEELGLTVILGVGLSLAGVRVVDGVDRKEGVPLGDTEGKRESDAV